MKIFSALNKGYSPLKNAIDNPLKSLPESFSECCELARLAVQFSQWKDERATDLWTLITKTCWKKDISFSSLVVSELDSRNSVLEAVIGSRDWESCSVVSRALRPGVYCNGRVEKTAKSLILNLDGVENQLGLLESVELCYYAGDLRHGQRHGQGVTRLSDSAVFECDYKDNRKHGWGVYRNTRENRIMSEGLYIDNKLVGNPRLPLPRQSGYLSFLSRK